MPRYLELAFNVPVRRTFTYRDLDDAETACGVRVMAPFGRRRLTGFVVGAAAQAPVGVELRAIIRRIDEQPVFDAEFLQLARWVADTYLCTLGEALAAMIPAGRRETLPDEFDTEVEGWHEHPLTAEQQRAVAAITAPLARRIARSNGSNGRGGGDRGRGGPNGPGPAGGGRNDDGPTRTSGASETAGTSETAGASGTAGTSETARASGTAGTSETAGAAGAAGAAGVTGAAGAAGATGTAGAAGATETSETAGAAGTSGTSGAAGTAPARFYLRGITGSGKTAVFLAAARRTVAAGRGVIYLVPEISLTHQVVDQFSDVFGAQVAVIHSALTPSQRLHQWSQIRSGAAQVVIGARSAVFAPLRDLGLIVLDEEHEASYKSSATPRYHARQVAMHRCAGAGATLVMGSATPSLEALHHMERGYLQRLELTRRPGHGRIPAIEVVEMKGVGGPLSPRLLQEIQATAAAGRQTILFLNRRGFASLRHCRSCGYEMHCVHCSVGLTYHKATAAMLCHYCGYRTRPMQVCPECASLDVGSVGYGTQRVEEELAAALPGLRVRRLDTDAMRNRRDLRAVLAQFRDRAVDVLVGTQMVAKGLNFPAVRLVGIVNADTGLHLPDFRAAERTFNLIVQVSGRAGRTLPDGRVFVQTFRADQPAIRLAVEGRAEEFYRRELALRRELRFPPFVRMIRVVFRSRSQQRAAAAASRFAEQLNDSPASSAPAAAPPSPAVLGPVECPIERIAGNYRYHLLLRHPTLGPLHARVTRTYLQFKPPPGVYVEVDIDPVSVL